MEINKVYIENCIDGLKQVDNDCIDFVLTDPPFNVNIDYGDVYNDNVKDVEYYHWCYSWIKELYRVLKIGSYAVIFTGDKKLYWMNKAIVDSGFTFHHFIKWHKPNGQRSLSGTVFFNRTELAFVVSKGKPDLKRINRKVVYSDTIICKNTKPNDRFNSCEHNCRRPVELYRKLINGFTKEDDIVLDCFMGSGTTAIACKQIKRNYIGFEINKEYVDLSKNKIYNVPLRLEEFQT